MKRFAFGICLFFLFRSATIEHHINFTDFCNNFVTGYRSLNIPDLQLSYAENLQHIQPAYALQRQSNFFEQVKNNLAVYKKDTLTLQERDDLALIEYETDLNIERIVLEQKWLREKPAVISMNNFHSVPNDSAWYVYFVKRWSGGNVNPEELYLNGLEEIERVQQRIENIRLQAGMDPAAFYLHLNDSSFFITDELKVKQAFERTKDIVLKNLDNIFNVASVPDINIQSGKQFKACSGARLLCRQYFLLQLF